MTDLTPLADALISLCTLVVTTILIPFLQSKLALNQLERTEHWHRLAVEAAEEMFDEPHSGKQKMQFVETYLEQHHIKPDIVLIESQVYELKAERR